MKENVLARRYARALFELAQEKEILDNIHREVGFFDELLKANPRLRFFLNSPEIGVRDKKKVMEKLLLDRVSNVFFNFILVLLDKNRQLIFGNIVKEFQRIFDRYRKKLRASTITAIPLDEPSESRLKQFLSDAFNSDVQIDNRIDPNILGGIIVRVDGRVFDGSLKSQLQRLKRGLAEEPNSKMV